MGPPSIRGRTLAAVPCEFDHHFLQWNRGPSIEEDAPIENWPVMNYQLKWGPRGRLRGEYRVTGPVTSGNPLLQWGRGPISRITRSVWFADACFNEIMVNTMEQDAWPWRPRFGRLNFNGAATQHRGTPRGISAACVRCTRFNEVVAKHHGGRGIPGLTERPVPASMRPQC